MEGIVALLMAAGESTRMGRTKALLPWRGVTLVEYQIECLARAGAEEVIVVLGHDADSVAPYVTGTGARYTVNLRYRQGKTTSIKAGLEAMGPAARGVMLLAVDQPRTVEIISRVVLSHRESGALITSPRYRGHGGHPLVFSSPLRDELGGIEEETQGIREVFDRHRHQVNEMEFDDPVIRLDLNTIEEYEEARRRLGA